MTLMQIVWVLIFVAGLFATLTIRMPDNSRFGRAFNFAPARTIFIVTITLLLVGMIVDELGPALAPSLLSSLMAHIWTIPTQITLMALFVVFAALGWRRDRRPAR